MTRLFRSPKVPYPVQFFWGMASIVLSTVARIQRGQVVLTSFHGDGFRGNTAVLFEALLSHPAIQPIWLTRNPHVFRVLSRRFPNADVRLMHSLHGVRALARAEMLLFTHGITDFPFLRLPHHALKVFTYHGLPTKRGEYWPKEGVKPPRGLKRLVLWYKLRSISGMLSSSEEVSTLFGQRFGLAPSTFFETGFPATDRLLHPEPDPQLLHDLGVAAFAHPPRILLYAPTFRKRSQTRWWPFPDANLETLRAFLEQHNAVLAVRAHPNDRVSANLFVQSGGRIVDAGEHVVEDAERLLAASAVVLTDYSSVFLEAFLARKPVLFLDYDRDLYERGFPYDYDEVTPGPHPRTQKEALEALSGLLASPREDPWESEREEVARRFFSQRDGASTQRVVQLLEHLLGLSSAPEKTGPPQDFQRD